MAPPSASCRRTTSRFDNFTQVVPGGENQVEMRPGGFWNDQNFDADPTSFGYRGYVIERDYFTDNKTVQTISAAGILANDTDADGDTLTIVGVGDGTHHSALGALVSIDSNGNIVYDPTSSSILSALHGFATATDSFSYTISDGHGGTATATISFNVGAIIHAPVASDVSQAIS